MIQQIEIGRILLKHNQKGQWNSGNVRVRKHCDLLKGHGIGPQGGFLVLKIEFRSDV